MAIPGWGIPGRSATRSPTQLPHARTAAKASLKDLQPLAHDKTLLCGWDVRSVQILIQIDGTRALSPMAGLEDGAFGMGR